MAPLCFLVIAEGRHGMFFANGEDRAKLTILYILRGCQLPLSREALETAAAENAADNEQQDLMTIPNRLSSLEAEGFIAAITVVGAQMYFLTRRGADVIDLLDKTLAKSYREKLDDYIAAHLEEYHLSSTARSDYNMRPDGSYEAKLALVESGKPIFELSIMLPSAEATRNAGKKWENANAELYLQVLQWLTEE